MSIKFGIDGKLYYCAAGIGGTPTWTELSGVKNVTLNVQGKEVDVTTRASAGFALADIALMDASIEFDLPLDPDDAGFTRQKAVGFTWSRGGVRVA